MGTMYLRRNGQVPGNYAYASVLPDPASNDCFREIRKYLLCVMHA